MNLFESCPVCLTDDTTSWCRLRGCGHYICRGCKTNLKKSMNQYIINKYDQKFVKCPMCRSFEKPSYKHLEQQVKCLLDEVAYKNRRIVELCDGRLAAVLPVQAIGLVHPLPPALHIGMQPNPLMVCRRNGCTRRNRTRDRCRNHPDTPCCSSCRINGCNTCRTN